MRNSLEGVPESHPTKDAILEVIKKFKEGGTVIKEKTDEFGPYLIEVRFDGKEGEYTQCEYMRKGNFPGSHSSLGTSVNVVHYNNDLPCGGENKANFNYNTQQWEDA